jgi:hypothetical protein
MAYCTMRALHDELTYLRYVLRVGEPSGIYLILQKTCVRSSIASSTSAIVCTHENRVGNDRLRLGRGGGGVVVIGCV